MRVLFFNNKNIIERRWNFKWKKQRILKKIEYRFGLISDFNDVIPGHMFVLTTNMDIFLKTGEVLTGHCVIRDVKEGNPSVDTTLTDLSDELVNEINHMIQKSNILNEITYKFIDKVEKTFNEDQIEKGFIE